MKKLSVNSILLVLAALLLLSFKPVTVKPAAPGGMVFIPGGKYKLFFKKKSEAAIQVKPFFIDKYEVTNNEYLQFVKANPQWRKSKVSRLYADNNYLRHWESDLLIGKNYEKIKNSPVTNISWFAAKAYCKWKGKRLPTVLEWEYAASAAPAGKPKTNVLQIILEWYTKPSAAWPASVGSSFKNQFGVYDMHGLVWEWTFDFNSFISGGDSRSGSEVNRGLFCGSAAATSSASKEDYAAYMRYGFRGSLKGNYTVANLGFRCASDLKK